MARIYLRLKHFVASYVRKVYGDGDDPSQTIRLNKYSRAAMHLERMQCNVADKVVANCFCERQWKRMTAGESIERDADNWMVTPRDEREWLTEAEVCRLSGIEPMRGEEMGEYVCIDAPSVIIRQDGTQMQTNGQWQLMADAASDLISELDEDFDRAMFEFVDNCMALAKAKGQKRYANDAMEAFMTSLNIRNCDDDREKRCLKRRYYRYMRDKMLIDEDDDFHTGKELQKREAYVANNARKVICEDDGEIYASIYAAARHYGLRYRTLWECLKKGYKCRGMRFAMVG